MGLLLCNCQAVLPHHPYQNNPFKNLDSLNTSQEESLTDVFMASLHVIFSNTLEDVQSSLGRFCKDGLGRLHKALCIKVAETFSQYKDRKPINRQVKHTLVSDIAVLGYSLANESLNRELDKIFHNANVAHLQVQLPEGNTPSLIQQSEVGELLSVVTDLNALLKQHKVN